MPGLTKYDLQTIPRRVACTSGDNTFFLNPGNKIGYVSSLNIDAFHASGLINTVQITLRDTFMPVGGSTGTSVIFQVSFDPDTAAEAMQEISLPSPIQFQGLLEVRTNISGPIVSMAAMFR